MIHSYFLILCEYYYNSIRMITILLLINNTYIKLTARRVSHHGASLLAIALYFESLNNSVTQRVLAHKT